jgi:small GTP-binding protein
MLQKKICMAGAFGVGKTSLVRRFVESLFDERYQTTIGVKIDKKVLVVEGRELTLLIWDLAGEDEMQEVRISYLRGASGFILVADGCRKATLAQAAAIRGRAVAAVGEIPCLLAVNKSDCRDQWEVAPRDWDGFGLSVFETSAKTGDGVELMFEELATRMLRNHADRKT